MLYSPHPYPFRIYFFNVPAIVLSFDCDSQSLNVDAQGRKANSENPEPRSERDRPLLRGWRNAVGSLIEMVLAQTNLSRASPYWYTREQKEGYGFIELEISSSTISTVFRPTSQQTTGGAPFKIHGAAHSCHILPFQPIL